MTTEFDVRLARLEKRLAGYRLLTAVSMLFAVVAVIMAWRTASNGPVVHGTTVEASKFVLKDAAGKVRGTWEMNVLNKPGLAMGWPGYNSVYLGETGDGASLGLWGGARVFVNAGKDDAGISMHERPVPAPTAGSEWYLPEEYLAVANSKYVRLSTSAHQLILQSRFGRFDMDTGRNENIGPMFQMRDAGEILPGFEVKYGQPKRWAARVRLPGTGPGERYYELPPKPPSP